MNCPIRSRLVSVRRRQEFLFVLRMGVSGLLASSLAGIVMGSVRWLANWDLSLGRASATLVAGPLIGLLVGWLYCAIHRDWRAAASAVDAHYCLKDRATTALAFVTLSAAPAQAAMRELQLQDAALYLARVIPRDVVPLRWPRILSFAGALLVVALALLVWPLGPQTVAAGPVESIPGIVAQAEQLAEELRQLEELTGPLQNEEVEQLLKELRAQAEEMQEPGVDVREALAKLSEMQASIQAQLAQFNQGAVDQQLQSLAAAMSSAKALEPTAKALADGKYDKAAQELAKLDNPRFDRKESRATSEKLRKSAQEMDAAGLREMSAATQEMAGAIERDECEQCKEGACKLGKCLAKAAGRKKLNDLLKSQLAKLGECKGACQTCNKNGGQGNQKSNHPSQNWGLGKNGEINGERTDLKANRQREQVTGKLGEGDSEFESSSSPEGEQQAQRAYQEAYQKYRKLSEAVLDSEQIPLGHRQTIRRYFESIRPQNADESPRPAVAPN